MYRTLHDVDCGVARPPALPKDGLPSHYVQSGGRHNPGPKLPSPGAWTSVAAMQRWYLALAIAVLAASCGGSQASRSGLAYGENARLAYEDAMAELEDGNCMEAAPAFRKIRREYPYSRYAALSELRAADCLFIQDKYIEAAQAYRQFVRYRPSHEKVPYARFRIAKANFEQIPSGWLLAPPVYERDQAATHRALDELRTYLAEYPKHESADEAREMQRQTLRLLAQHELYVARFYLDRGHPQAAVSRLRTLLNSYRGSGVEPEAMLLLAETYLDIEDPEQARQVLNELVEGFPKSEQADRARDHLEELAS